MKIEKLGVWCMLDGMPLSESIKAVNKIENLGYSALWYSGNGRHPFVSTANYAANTKKLILATGITSIYDREPGDMVAGQLSLCESSDNRFILGLGVSHKPMVEGIRQVEYKPPVPTMRQYLESMASAAEHQTLAERMGDGATKDSDDPQSAGSERPIILAALGPKMLELSATKAQGAHPYFVSPDHTAMAREIMGKGPLLCPEQKVILETNPTKAREVARQVLPIYDQLPNYRNNWKRMGFEEKEFENGGTDKFIDATFAWGSVDDIERRLKEHYDAGADHICIQPLNPVGNFFNLHWEVLEALAPH